MIYVETSGTTDLFIPRGATITCDCDGDGGCPVVASINLTQAEYDALDNPSCDIYYNIISED